MDASGETWSQERKGNCLKDKDDYPLSPSVVFKKNLQEIYEFCNLEMFGVPRSGESWLAFLTRRT